MTGRQCQDYESMQTALKQYHSLNKICAFVSCDTQAPKGSTQIVSKTYEIENDFKHEVAKQLKRYKDRLDDLIKQI